MIINLDKIAWFQEGPGVRNYQYKTTGTKLINVSNLGQINLNLSNTSRYISNEEANGKYKHFLCDAGDLVIASSGINEDSISQKVSFVRDTDLPLCMNTSVIRFKCLNEKELNIKYLYYFFKSNSYKKQILKLMTGIAQLNFGPSHLHKVTINYVNRVKQENIIKRLDLLSNLIATQEKQLKLLDELIKSRFIEMFETIDLSEEKPEWVELEKLTKIYTGTTPSSTDESNWNGDILWITPAEIDSDSFYIYNTVRKITEKGRKSKSLDIMPINTVLLSTRAPIGKVGIVGKPMACNQGFKNFECGTKLIPIFLYTLLKNNTDYLNSLGSGTTFLEVSKSRIAKLKVPVPKIELQNEFESFVKQIDKSKFVVQKRIELYKELLNKKMDEYFN